MAEIFQGFKIIGKRIYKVRGFFIKGWFPCRARDFSVNIRVIFLRRGPAKNKGCHSISEPGSGISFNAHQVSCRLVNKKPWSVMYFPKARLWKYSITPTLAWAVQEPRSIWFSIGEHQLLRSTNVGSSGTLDFFLEDRRPSFSAISGILVSSIVPSV